MNHDAIGICKRRSHQLRNWGDDRWTGQVTDWQQQGLEFIAPPISQMQPRIETYRMSLFLYLISWMMEMASRSKPTYLVVTCVVALVLNQVLSALVGLLRFFSIGLMTDLSVLQYVIPELITWGISVWLAARTEAPSIRSLIVVGALMFLSGLSIALRFITIPEFLGYLLYQNLCAISYNYVATMLLCRSLGIGLIEAEYTDPTPPNPLSIKHIFYAGSLVAATVAMGGWAKYRGYIMSIDDQNLELYNQMSQMINACGTAALFCSVIWWLRSSRHPWLGLAGIAMWLATRVGSIAIGYLLFEPEALSSFDFWKRVLIWNAVSSLYVLAVIPLLGMFGYRFWVNAGSSGPKPIEVDMYRSPFDD